MVLEIYILYFALVFHTVLWGFGLKAVDIMKDGGSIKSLFQSKVATTANTDAILDEDHDVKVERAAVEDYMDER